MSPSPDPDNPTSESALTFNQVSALLQSGRLRMRKLIDDTGVVLDTKTGHVSTLNETATFVLEQVVAGFEDPEVLVERLTAEFEIDADTARQDLRLYLESVTGTFTEDD